MLNKIKVALNNTHGKAKIKIYPNCFFNECVSELNPPSKIRSGKKIIKIPYG
jgi:hypothetical protein